MSLKPDCAGPDADPALLPDPVLVTQFGRVYEISGQRRGRGIADHHVHALSRASFAGGATTTSRRSRRPSSTGPVSQTARPVSVTHPRSCQGGSVRAVGTSGAIECASGLSSLGVPGPSEAALGRSVPCRTLAGAEAVLSHWRCSLVQVSASAIRGARAALKISTYATCGTTPG